MTLRTSVLGTVVVCALASVAVAGGSWMDKVNYRYSNATSLKVTEPEGFKVSVVGADGTEKSDTVPALFPLPDADAYVKVTLTAPDGTSWNKKIEIRSKQQAELAVQFKADQAQPAQKPAGRSFVGKFLNEGGGCGTAWAKSIKVEFIAGDGSVARSTEIATHTYQNLELAAGKYDVRVYLKNGDVWDYQLTSSREIAKDGWLVGYGCQKGSKKPAIVTAD